MPTRSHTALFALLALTQWLPLTNGLATDASAYGASGVRLRRVDFGAGLSVGIFELEKPGPLIQNWMTSGISNPGRPDPFGVVLWPGAHAAVRLMQQHRERISDGRVLCLGAGTGLEALAAAQLGAAQVLACDINPLSLELLRDAAAEAGVSDAVSTREFDLRAGGGPLPTAAGGGGFDAVVFADLMYNEELAGCVGRRAAEAAFASCATPPWLIVTDSQRFAGTGPAFFEALEGSAGAEEPLPGWQETRLEAITGSGILIEEDVTYDVEVRYLSWRAGEGGVREDVLGSAKRESRE